MIQTNKTNFEPLEGDWNRLIPFKIDRIVDSPKGLEIFVSGTQGNPMRGVFSFDTYYGYRNFDEGDLLSRWQQIGVLHSGFYAASCSELLDWATAQSPYEALPEGLTNYLFVSIEDVLDVLAFDPPRFMLTDN